MLTMNERMLKLATADQRTLARVDGVLTGEDTATAAFADADCRTTTYTDAARRLNVSRPTVYQLVKAGRLDVLTINGTNRVTLRSLTELANGRRPPDAETIERMKARRDRMRTVKADRRGGKQSNEKRGEA